MTKEELAELIEEVGNNMCDNYCKIPCSGMSEKEMDEACEDCPLDRLMDVRGKEIE